MVVGTKSVLVTVSEAFELYRKDVIVFRNQSKSNEEKHRWALKYMLEFLGDIPIENLTFEDVRNWKAWLDKGKRNDSTVREYIIRLRVVLRHLQKRGYNVLDYELVSIPKRVVRPPEFLTSKQVADLIYAVGLPARGYPKINRVRNCAVISLLYASGIRASELRQLNRYDIREDNSFTVQGKGDKVRLCFIDNRTRLLLEDYFRLRTDNNPALFIANQTGQRLSRTALERIFEEARKKVDFNVPLHAHVLRHSYATNLLRNNTNLRYVQVLLGHSSIQTTQLYSHVVDKDLQKIYDEHHTV